MSKKWNLFLKYPPYLFHLVSGILQTGQRVSGSRTSQKLTQLMTPLSRNSTGQRSYQLSTDSTTSLITGWKMKERKVHIIHVICPHIFWLAILFVSPKVLWQIFFKKATFIYYVYLMHSVMILSFRTDMHGQTVTTQRSSLVRVDTVWHFVCIFWKHYPLKKITFVDYSKILGCLKF